MAIAAVIFDWGGTLTPWHTIDVAELWLDVCAAHYPDDHGRRAADLYAAEVALWRAAGAGELSPTIDHIFQQASVHPTDAFLASYMAAWEPHTFTDPDAATLMAWLRGRGIKVGVLSNTMWPRRWHDEVFRRDGVLHLIDGAAYSSELPRTKPHPSAFEAAMAAVEVSDPAQCVFVGDRPWDDIHGAKTMGMRAVLLPNDGVPAFPAAQPDAVISRLAELPALIDAW